MYGHLSLIVKSFIVTCYGQQVWDEIRKKTKVKDDIQEDIKYPDDTIYNVITVAAECTGFPREQFLELLGEHYIRYLIQKGYRDMLTNFGHNMLEFLQNVDSIHYNMANRFPEMSAPFFRCTDNSSADSIELHYYSNRKGYHSMIIGIVRTAASILYRTDVKVTVLSNQTEDNGSKTGRTEHVTFAIRVAKVKDDDQTEGQQAPTFVAQTRKHGERQIDKTDVEAVTRKLDELKRNYGELALPLAAAKRGKAKWKAVARMTAMANIFAPVCPEVNPVTSRMFIDLFPYHVIFNRDLHVQMSGVQLQKLMPAIRDRGAIIPDFFNLVYPRDVQLKFETLCRLISCPVMLSLQKKKLNEAKYSPIVLKGQMYLINDQSNILYMGCPLVRTWHDLQNTTLTFADISQHDPTREFLFRDEYERMAGTTPVNSNAVTTSSRSASGSHSEEVVTALLPNTYVSLLQNGQRPKAGLHNDVTALFCDIVEFSKMAAKCRPSETIRVLNEVYTKFDTITSVHGVFRVETVGDAYFVVSGVPGRCPTHGERVANTALGMIAAARGVKSPLGGRQVMIRIGLHTGSVVSGVVGSTVPRLMVFGETAITAARMESHGVPGRIQISQSTFRTLNGKGFAFEQRGEIPIRGLGKMMTHFLVSNQNATEEDLMGKPLAANQDVSFINEGKQTSAVFEKNKIHPTNTNDTYVRAGTLSTMPDNGFVPFHYRS